MAAWSRWKATAWTGASRKQVVNVAQRGGLCTVLVGRHTGPIRLPVMPARHIPPDVRASHPRVNWRGATGMRDKMIHDYFGVDDEVVWRTVHEDLPPLQAAIEAMLKDTGF